MSQYPKWGYRDRVYGNAMANQRNMSVALPGAWSNLFRDEAVKPGIRHPLDRFENTT